MEYVQHNLKILPEYYTAICRNVKTFEVRYNDRNYKVGDILHLREWSADGYTGNTINVIVTYILSNTQFVKEGYVIMSIKVLSN